jgi:hypothetical protein
VCPSGDPKRQPSLCSLPHGTSCFRRLEQSLAVPGGPSLSHDALFPGRYRSWSCALSGSFSLLNDVAFPQHSLVILRAPYRRDREKTWVHLRPPGKKSDRFYWPTMAITPLRPLQPHVCHLKLINECLLLMKPSVHSPSPLADREEGSLILCV